MQLAFGISASAFLLSTRIKHSPVPGTERALAWERGGGWVQEERNHGVVRDLPRDPPQGDLVNAFICLPSDRTLGRKGVTADLDISFSRVSLHSLARRQTSLKLRADCHPFMPKPAAWPKIRKRRRPGRPWTSHLQSVLSAGLKLRVHGSDLLGEWGKIQRSTPPWSWPITSL